MDVYIQILPDVVSDIDANPVFLRRTRSLLELD